MLGWNLRYIELSHIASLLIFLLKQELDLNWLGLIISLRYDITTTLRYHFITSFLLFMHVCTKLYKMKRIFVSYIHRLWHSQRNRQSAIILLWKPISRPIHIHYWPIGQIWIFMLLFTRCVFVVPVEMWNDLSSIDLLLLHVTIHL